MRIYKGGVTDIDRAINWLRREKSYRTGHEPTDFIDLAIQALEEKKVRDENSDAGWSDAEIRQMEKM